MKRDWELVREILTKLEEFDSTQKALYPKDVEGYSEEAVSYHIHLLYQAGLISATISATLNGPISGIATSLTWDGHEFLDTIRTTKSWNRIKEFLLEKGLDMSFEAIKKAGSYVIENVLS